MHSAPVPTKLKLLQRAVLPIASYRMPRWPYQASSASRVDRMQTKMVGILMGLRMQSGEDPAIFVRRRNRAAARVAKQHGRWSTLWCKRVTSWHDHLNRPQNSSSWASKTWLQEQRRVHAVGGHASFTAGRTCTRVSRGVVHRRWHDGVDVARSQ